MGYIYKVTNKKNGKVYIGKTSQEVENRWSAHVYTSFNKNSREYNFKFHNAIRKYGKDAFAVEVIDDVEDTEVANREKYWIEFYDSIRSGYNTTYGGEGTMRYSDEFILECWKSGMTYKEIHETFGVSIGTIGTRLKAMFPEEERKLRKIQSLKKANGVPVYQYSLDGSFVNSFCSVNEAIRLTGIRHIDAVANGKRNKAGGYVWSYTRLEEVIEH